MSWSATFPAPKATAPDITAEQLAALKDGEYIVVDVRRTDIDDNKAVHPAAVNLPAHTFYPTLKNVARVLQGTPKLIFHCNSCSPGGRGPKSAGWYLDDLAARGLAGSQEVYVLQGGWKAWVAAYPERVVAW